jgi:hypothetical protein
MFWCRSNPLLLLLTRLYFTTLDKAIQNPKILYSSSHKPFQTSAPFGEVQTYKAALGDKSLAWPLYCSSPTLDAAVNCEAGNVLIPNMSKW